MPPISFVPDRLRCSAASKSDLIVYYRHFPCARPKGPIVWSTPTGPVARRSRKSSPLSFAADHSNEEIGPQVARPASTDDGVARSADGGSTPTSAGAPSPPKVGFGPVRWHRLLRLSHKKVLVNVWPLLVVHLLCDTLVFMLHRTSHRVTNELAVMLASGRGITPSAIGNMWWLTGDPSIANFNTGYQTLTIIVFLLAFPLNVLLKTLASTATVLVCSTDAGGPLSSSIPWWKLNQGLSRAFAMLRGSIWPQVKAIWYRVFAVELLVSAAVIPLQFASLAVITLPLTLPLILSLYAAAPAAVLEARQGLGVVWRSRELIKPVRWALAIPFVGLVVAQRALEIGKERAMAALPARFYRELIEIPAVVLIGGLVLTVYVARLQDVMPFVVFSEAKRIGSIGVSVNKVEADGKASSNEVN